jgi:hypothetical protein
MPLEPKPTIPSFSSTFMSYRDDEEYERDNEFTPEELECAVSRMI